MVIQVGGPESLQIRKQHCKTISRDRIFLRTTSILRLAPRMFLVKNCLWLLVFGLPALISAITTDAEYDFIVVGSGAGGGPLACRLAEANYKTLLIEAGNDQGNNVNVSIPAFQGVVAQDPKLRWDVSLYLWIVKLKSLTFRFSSTSTITKISSGQNTTPNWCTTSAPAKRSLVQILLSVRYQKAYYILAQAHWEDA